MSHVKNRPTLRIFDPGGTTPIHSHSKLLDIRDHPFVQVADGHESLLCKCMGILNEGCLVQALSVTGSIYVDEK